MIYNIPSRQLDESADRNFQRQLSEPYSARFMSHGSLARVTPSPWQMARVNALYATGPLPLYSYSIQLGVLNLINSRYSMRMSKQIFYGMPMSQPDTQSALGSGV